MTTVVLSHIVREVALKFLILQLTGDW